MNNKILVGSLIAGILIIGATSAVFAAGPNYQGFRAMMGNRAPQVTEQNLDRFNAMHQAMINGDYATMQKIRTDLGLGQGQGRGNGGGCPMANGIGGGRLR